jgi:hypothetical protein
MKAIQDCSNEEPGPFQRGYSHKKCFSKHTWLILVRLFTDYPWGMEIQICSNERDTLF